MAIQFQQDAIIITDASMQIQYANNATERLLHTKIVRNGKAKIHARI